jgi:hypothetical protein
MVLKEHLTVSNTQICNDTDGIIIYQTPIDIMSIGVFILN